MCGSQSIILSTKPCTILHRADSLLQLVTQPHVNAMMPMHMVVAVLLASLQQSNLTIRLPKRPDCNCRTKHAMPTIKRTPVNEPSNHIHVTYFTQRHNNSIGSDIFYSRPSVSIVSKRNYVPVSTNWPKYLYTKYLKILFSAHVGKCHSPSSKNQVKCN